MSKSPTRQSQTYYILQDFEKKDWQDLKDYFNSPFFYKKPKSGLSALPNLIKLLSEYYHDGNRKSAPSPDAKYLLSKLYPNKKVDKRRINNLLSKLEEHLNIFFAHRKLNEDKPFLSNALTLESLNERDFKESHLRKYMENKLNKFEKELNTIQEQDADYWLNQYFLAQTKSLFYQSDGKFNQDIYVNDTIQNLNLFYIIEKMKYWCSLLNRNASIYSSLDEDTIEAFEEYVEKLSAKITKEKPPVFYLYYNYFKSLIYQDESIYFKNLQRLFIDHNTQISAFDQTNFRRAILNYFSLQINNGKAEYMYELHAFYRELLEIGALQDRRGNYRYGDYRNIIVVALKVDEWEWAAAFAEGFKNQIKPDQHAMNTYVYCQGLLCYYKADPDYEGAIDWLEKVNDRFVFSELWARMLKIRCRYDANSSDLLVEYDIKSFSEYLRRNKKVANVKAYQTCIQILKRIAGKRNLKKTGKTYLNLKKAIEENKFLLHKDWLLQKLEEKLE